jgi:hypothetical protein
MITEIGIIAGEIWHYLDKRGEVTLTELIRGIDKSRDLTLMSLGWLAREGHVLVRIDSGELRASLRQSS